MNGRSREIDSRYRHIVLFVVLLMIALAVRLFVLTVVQHDHWVAEASEQTTKTIYTSAPRGNIYDRNGNLLAGSRQVFTATFNASNMTTLEINDSILTMMRKLEENGDEYNDDFPIIMDEEGHFSYTYDEDRTDWLTSRGYDPDTSAEKIFELVKDEYGISDELDRFEAMDELYTRHNVTLPILTRTMKFTYDQQRDNFLAKFGFSQADIEAGIPADECFHELRSLYKIDESLSDEEARKIFIVRNKIAEGSSQRYLPITVATDISDLSVIYFEEMDVPGVGVASETERYYPNGSLACQMIGYMGAISEGEYSYYVTDRDYLPTDLVGKDGIEAALEEELHGTPSIRTIVVNSAGEYVSTVSEQEGEKGSDVYLTLDLPLQKATEKALKKAVEENESARSGAAVILDVKTSDVLASASYPWFDLNTFADGISAKEWAAVQPENPRDAFSPAPLYNNVTRAAVAPGSTFKPLTAITALECGLDPNLQILDDGYIEISDRTFACSMWNSFHTTDGWQDLEWGMGHSCNYYFACIATGKDWRTGESLGYDISIDDILARAHDFGLDQETGIEVAETVMPAVSTDTKMSNYRAAVWYAIYEKAHLYFPPEVYNDYDKLSKNITTIADWIYDNPNYWDLVELLDTETDVLDDELEDCASMVKFDYFIQAEFTTFDVFNTAIGQGDNTNTPIQVANYIATIGNHGLRNQVSLVYGVEGEGRTVKKDPVDVGLAEENRAAVLKGMERVCTSGTLSSAFEDFPVSVAGKTGTAEYQAIKQPEDEMAYVEEYLDKFNEAAGTDITWEEVQDKVKELMFSDANTYPTQDDTVDAAVIALSDHRINQTIINAYKETYDYFAWIVAMAPADDPEVCVVLMLPEGGFASDAGDAVAEMLSAYFDNTDSGTYAATDNTGTNKMQ